MWDSQGTFYNFKKRGENGEENGGKERKARRGKERRGNQEGEERNTGETSGEEKRRKWMKVN